MPIFPQPNLRRRPHTARTAPRQRDPELPVGGVHFRTGEPVLPKEYAPKTFRAPLTSRIRPSGYSDSILRHGIHNRDDSDSTKRRQASRDLNVHNTGVRDALFATARSVHPRLIYQLVPLISRLLHALSHAGLIAHLADLMRL